MPIDVAGALLGTAFGETLKIVVDVATKAHGFKPLLDQLESTLTQITLIYEDTERLNRILDHNPQETKGLANKLEKGKKLVLKCARVPGWNFYLKYSLAKKLADFEKSLATLFQIDVTAQIWRNGLKTLDTMNRVETIVRHGFSIGKSELGSGNGGLVGYCGALEVRRDVFGLEEPIRKVKEMVVTTGGKKVVVVSAPGGCGKSTLAKMVCHHEDVTGMFKDNIFFVVVSQTPNLIDIMEKLFQHKGLPVPKFQTDEDAINQLEHMLKKIEPNPILLVLDDVWWSGVESFIEHLAIQIPTIKILVTSRSVFPKFESTTYKLKPLNDKDAMDLFRHSASPQDGSSSIPDDDDLLVKIVKGCGGFPLALQVVGRSLSGKSEEFWNWTLQQWREHEQGSLFSSASNREILICLLTSVDSLGEVYKECYLDLASFPEDKRIPESALIDMWVGRPKLNEDGDAIALLQELSSSNLVDLVVSRKEATQHDLLRELAIHQCNQELINKRERLILEIQGNDFPSWWMKPQQLSICARLVSISTDENFSSNWLDLQLSEVEVLVLNIKSRNYTLPQFMEKMKQLKVLIITNYGFFSSKIQSIPVLCGLPNLKRIRFERVLISSINDSILNMGNLQKISFIMCEISKAFRNCTIQIPNMLPNLLEIVIDYCSDLVEFPAFLCEIQSLEKLSITNCHELVTIAEEFGKLDNLKVLKLHACTKLSKLPDTIGSLKKLEFLDMSECIGIKELPLSIKDLEKLKKVKCDEKIVDQWQHKLKNLKIEVHKEEASLDWLH